MRKRLGHVLDFVAEVIHVARIGRAVENGTLTIDQARAAITGVVLPADEQGSGTRSTKDHELVA